MSECIGDRSLKQCRGRDLARSTRESLVKGGQRGKEARHLIVPLERRGVVPDLFAAHHRRSPVEEISHVRQGLNRRARTVTILRGAETLGRFA